MNKQIANEAIFKISSFLKSRREELNLTQQQLAFAVGVKRETINRIEAGKFLPGMELFLLITKKLDLQLLAIDKDIITVQGFKFGI